MESSGLLFLFFLLASADLCKAEKNVNNIFNWSYDNITVYSTLNELMNIIDLLLNQQDAENARSFGCSLDIKNKLAECQGKCTTISCYYQELKKFMSACWSGTKQSCNGEGECKICGLANQRMARRRGGNPKRAKSNRQTQSTRISGGVEVNPPKKYPWQVMLKLGTTYLVAPTLSNMCGGSIINSRWILTAGRCLQPNFDKLWVTIGEHDLSDNDNGTAYRVKRQVLHPGYEIIGNQTFDVTGSKAEYGILEPIANNDFGLLELDVDIIFNDDIRPVCLPEDDSKTYAGEMATVSGWGITYFVYFRYGDDDTYDTYFSVTEIFSESLLEREVSINANDECKGWNNITDKHICAGPTSVRSACFMHTDFTDQERELKVNEARCALPTGGQDTCFTDTGGPLVVKDKDTNRYILVGVLSFRKFCYEQDKPEYSTIYSRVSKVLDWIRETTASGTC